MWWRGSPVLLLPLCLPQLSLTEDASLCRRVVWNDCNSRHCQTGGSPCCAHIEKHGNRRGADNRGQQKNCKSHCYSGICFFLFQKNIWWGSKTLLTPVNLEEELRVSLDTLNEDWLFLNWSENQVRYNGTVKASACIKIPLKISSQYFSRGTKFLAVISLLLNWSLLLPFTEGQLCLVSDEGKFL